MAEKTTETKAKNPVAYTEIVYTDIERVNSEMETLDMRGKSYAMVSERITAFRKLFPEGFITTDIIANDGTTILMRAKAGYYKEDGAEVILGTGYAQEVRGRGMVNGTSYVENCETSAVGRALGMMGFGINCGGGVRSAEEMINALDAQEQMKQDEKNEAREANIKGMKQNLPDPIGEPGAVTRKIVGVDANGPIYEKVPKKADVSTVDGVPGW